MIEDTVDDADLAALELERYGYTLERRRVQTEPELIAALASLTPDVVLTDFSMPTLDPERVLELIAEQGVDAPVVLLSGAISQGQALDLLRQGASDFVEKGQLERLGPAVQNACEQARVHGESDGSRGELAASEARYRALFDDAPDGILLMEGDRIADCNARALAIHARERADLIGRSVESISPAHQADGVPSGEKARAFVEAALAGATQAFEWEVIRGDGQQVTVEVVLGRIDHNGNTHLHAIVRDITARRRAEAERRMLSRAIEQAAEAIFVTDATETIEYVNPAFERITGYSGHEVQGYTPNFLCSGQGDKGTRARLRAAIEAGEAFEGVLVNRRRDGALYYADMSVAPVRSETGALTHFIASQLDISDKLRAEHELARIAYYDPVTDLPNRTLLMDRLHQLLNQRERHGGDLAVLQIDLDNFARVNDSWGHSGGDHALHTVGERLAALVDTDMPLARVGNDGFVVVAHLGPQSDTAERWIERIQTAITPPMTHDGDEIAITATIGIALAPQDAEQAETLIEHAETALNRARQQGPGEFAFYRPAMNAEARHALALERDLRQALERDEFHLAYQPQVDVQSGRIAGAEALLRWRHPERGTVSPAEFIPLLERSGLIVAVGQWVIEQACRRISEWQPRLKTASGDSARIAVNLSLVQFERQDLVAIVRAGLERTGADPRHLEVELTETSLAQHPQAAARTLQALRDLGVTVALDDFGVGYSSLSYLQRFPIDVVKIDRVFVQGITEDAGDAAILRAVLDLGHSRQMRTVAEGAETRQHIAALLAEGCRHVQGFYFSPPLAGRDFDALLDHDPAFPAHAAATEADPEAAAAETAR
jgi:diguanylate cyclase (GGDEF)-like protein/PAS domain S-box-containing protein